MSCPVCHTERWRSLFFASDYSSCDRFEVLSCLQCGTARTEPQPENLQGYYPPDYYGPFMKRFPGPIEAYESWQRGRRARRLTKSIGVSLPSILDLGCGRGVMLAELKSLGWRCQGTELTDESASAARERGIDVHTGQLESDSFKDGQFDVVTLWHSLEHLPHPRETIKWCSRWLRPGGLLIVAIPDFGSLQARVGGPRWFHLDVPRHLYHFNRRGLEMMLEAPGLKPAEWSYFSLVYDLFGWLQTLLNLAGFPLGLLYRRLHTQTRLSRSERLLLPLCYLACLPLGCLAMLLTLLGFSSTIEVWSVRE